MRSARRSRAHETGFVITLEFLLVTAIVVLPLLIGGVLLGRKLFTLYLNQREFAERPDSRAVVWDSSATPKVIGPAVGFDAFEAPLVIFRDDASKSGVVLGVRGTRMTSVGQVFYSDDACTSSPRIRAWSAAASTGDHTTAPVDSPQAYPPIGFLYQGQAHGYAMGNGNVLYASDESGGMDLTSTAGSPLYVWISQDTRPATAGVPSPPCFVVQDGITIEGLVDATPVIDFDAPGNYTPPFWAAFPTPIDGPALPSPFGEDSD
jgi:hypothetical protein